METSSVPRIRRHAPLDDAGAAGGGLHDLRAARIRVVVAAHRLDGDRDRVAVVIAVRFGAAGASFWLVASPAGTSSE
jgi:hypothetical protein